MFSSINQIYEYLLILSLNSISELLGEYLPEDNRFVNPGFEDPDLFKSVDDESWV